MEKVVLVPLDRIDSLISNTSSRWIAISTRKVVQSYQFPWIGTRYLALFHQCIILLGYCMIFTYLHHLHKTKRVDDPAISHF